MIKSAKNNLICLFSGFLVAVVIYIIAYFACNNEYVLPSPISILERFYKTLISISFYKALFSTLLRVVIAFVISFLLCKFTTLPIDGYIGIIVALAIVYSGFSLINGTLSPLLGEAPKEELVHLIEAKIRTYPSVIGIHDLVIHNYGYNKCFATVHVEIPANQDILYSHDIMDNIETALLKTHNIHLVIHMDPVETDNKEVAELKTHVIKRIKEET